MQKWEYLSVIAEHPSGKQIFQDYKPRYVSGQELRDWKRGTSLDDFTRNLGEQAWELVSCSVPVYGPVPMIMVFKRPK